MHKKNTLVNIQAKTPDNAVEIALPSSKSIANRALIINALGESKGNLKRMSEARDSQTMIRLLADEGPVWDVLDAGTTMRFLTAYAAAMNLDKVLTGTPRMQERPIGILVDALRELGASVTFEKNDGYPPLHIHGFGKQKTKTLAIRGDISSQYISALMMIAPMLPEGLSLELTGKIGSRPYIDMTRSVMAAFGVQSQWTGEQTVTVQPGKYKAASYTIEPDWSAASYWYSIVACGDLPEVLLTDLADDSIQGDRKMADIMANLGVQTRFSSVGAVLTPADFESEASIDFTDCPDIAQTVAVICAVKGIHCEMTGLESLRIKETDRIAALQNELSRIGSKLNETDYNKRWELVPGVLKPSTEPIETYHDHRMAMAFAPLAWKFPLSIKAPEVVNKSYPGFWKDLEKAGATLTFQD